MKFSKLKFKDGKTMKPIGKRKEEEPEIESIFQEKFKMKDKITTYQPFQGSGLILSSGKGVNGEETKFTKEIVNGDTLIIMHPILMVEEQRNVMLVLSDKSLMLEEPFTQDVTSFTIYTVQKKTQIEEGEDLTAEYEKKLQELNKTKPINKPVLNVRVKKGVWSYETKKVEVEGTTSKEELLNIREKMIKDKFCW